MKETWFSNRNKTSLEIIKYNSIADHKIKKLVKIEDSKVIEQLIDRIEQIPTNGEMMISFGSQAEHIDLIFSNDSQVETIQLYEKRFKTPSTGFNIGKSEIEEKLINDIEALLFPDFNKSILKVENLEIPFQDFTITFLGTEFQKVTTTSITYNKDKFLIKDKNTTQEIEIISGQLPPQEKEVKVNNTNITLLTFKAKEFPSLYPDYFQLVKE